MSDVSTTTSPSSVNLDRLESDVKSALATAPTSAMAAAIDPKTTSTPGADQIISRAGEALAMTHSYAMTQVDTLIARLQNLKMQMEADREAAHKKMSGFVRTVGSAVEHVNSINKLADDIEKTLHSAL